ASIVVAMFLATVLMALIFMPTQLIAGIPSEDLTFLLPLALATLCSGSVLARYIQTHRSRSHNSPSPPVGRVPHSHGAQRRSCTAPEPFLQVPTAGELTFRATPGAAPPLSPPNVSARGTHIDGRPIRDQGSHIDLEGNVVG